MLLDPYGRSIELGANYDRWAAARPGSNLACCAKNRVVDTRNYDWEGDKLPAHSLSRSVIYELHLGGFTKSPDSGVDPALRGTYLGLIEKIPYLQSLGVTAVELLPVFQFDPQDAPQGGSPTTGATVPCRSSPPTPSTPAAMIPSPSFATWSRRCTAPT